MSETARDRFADHLSHMDIVPPLHVLEHSELEPDVLRLINSNGTTALKVYRTPGALDVLEALADAANLVVAEARTHYLVKKADSQ